MEQVMGPPNSTNECRLTPPGYSSLYTTWHSFFELHTST